MIKNKRKGFTLVELVIVIAVIAILAAILIPVFASLIRKSNIDSDKVLVQNLNLAVEEYKVENSIEDVTEFKDVVMAIKQSGYVLSGLNAKTKGCYFIWDDETDQFLLVEKLTGNPKFEVLSYIYAYSDPDDVADGKANWYSSVRNVNNIDEVLEISENIECMIAIYTSVDLRDTVSNGGEQEIFVDDKLEFINGEKVLVNDSEDKITINLFDSEIIVKESGSTYKDHVPIEIGKGNVVIEGGTINGNGNATAAIGVRNVTESNVEIKNTKITNPDLSGIFLPIDVYTTSSWFARPKDENGKPINANTTTITNCEFVNMSDGLVIQGQSTAVFNDCTMEGITYSCFYMSYSGHVIVNSGTYKTSKYFVWIHNSSSAASDEPALLEIKGGTFISTYATPFNIRSGASGHRGVVITGGYFNVPNKGLLSYDQIIKSDWEAMKVAGSGAVKVGTHKVTGEKVVVFYHVGYTKLLEKSGIKDSDYKWS